jgi:hypothetical protein
VRLPAVVEEDAPAVMASEVSMGRTGMPAQEESGEEHHGDDEHHTRDDPDPRHDLVEPAGPTGGHLAGRGRRRIQGRGRRGRILCCLAHDFDDAQTPDRLVLK